MLNSLRVIGFDSRRLHHILLINSSIYRISVHSVNLLVRNQLSRATLEMTRRYIKRTPEILDDVPDARSGNVIKI